MFGPGAFRLLLAAAVLISHISPGGFGVVAVVAFFILSGYWVTRMYVDKYGGASGVRTFYLSRFLRLWPPFAVAILISILLRPLRGDAVSFNQFQVLSMLGVASGIRDPLGISWSLDIEMQFYLLLPLLVVAAQRLSSPRTIFVAITALTAFGWTFGFAAKVETVLSYLPAFAAGMAICLARYRPSGRAAALSVAAFFVIGVLYLSNSHTYGIVMQDPLPRRAVQFGSLFWGLALTPFVAWIVRQKGGRLDRHFGDFSYSLYLTHYPVVVTARHVFGDSVAFPRSLFLVPLCFAVALGFYVLIDRTIERWRVRLIESALAEKATP